MQLEYSLEELIDMDRRFIWHPFTQMMDWINEEPLIIASGEGNYLMDVGGHRYLDGVSSLWVNIHGHRRAEIDQALVRQLGLIAHSTFLGLSNVPAIKLAKKLIELTPPGLVKVFYSDDGSTAVEIALKMAFQYWQQCREPQPARNSFISFVNGYHGDTLGAVSVGGVSLFHDIYGPLLFKTLKIMAPYCYRCHWGREYPGCEMICLGEVEEVMERHHREVAAVIIEPLIQCAGGMLVFPHGYSRGVRDLAARYNVPFIADEVATGFGRTGRLFACEHEGIDPDFMVLAKGITGGYLPLAATVTTQEVFHAFYGEYKEKKTFYHGHTYTANPLSCAAALANLEIFEEDDVLVNLQEKIDYLERGLKPFLDLEHVGDVRHLGLMAGIELVKDRERKVPYPYEAKTGIRVIQEARRNGLIIRPLGDVIVLMPPLSVSVEELEMLLDITFHSIQKVTGD